MEEQKNSDAPKISVVIPVYRTEKYLKKCIESVLSQTFTDFELILINDGSPDNSGNICNQYAKIDNRIRVYHKKNGGVSSARNMGLDEAKGEWIAFLDSDDFWYEYYLSEANKLIDQYVNNVGIIAFAYYKVLNNKKELVSVFDGVKTSILDDPILYLNKIVTSSIIISSELCEKVGRFRLNIKRGEDLDFWLRFFCVSRLLYCSLPVFEYNYNSEYNSRKTNLLYDGFPYWEWYNYPYQNKESLFLYTSRLIFVYFKRSIKSKKIKKMFFYFFKIKWFYLFQDKILRVIGR